jgi:hypothetical protein
VLSGLDEGGNAVRLVHDDHATMLDHALIQGRRRYPA